MYMFVCSPVCLWRCISWILQGRRTWRGIMDMGDGTEEGMVQGIMDKDIIMGVMYCTHIILCPHIIMADFTPIHITMDTMKHHPGMAQEKHITQVVH